MSTGWRIVWSVVVVVTAWRWWAFTSEHASSPIDHAALVGVTHDLHDADGAAAPPDALRDARHVLVYFSASWCPPVPAVHASPVRVVP